MPTERDVTVFVEAAKGYVVRALGVDLDGSEASLAFVDHYLRKARESDMKDEVLALVAPAIGAYLGQVAIAKFGGRWVLESEDPSEWRVELEAAPLRFFPVGMAAEALRGDEVEGFDASFSTRPEWMPPLLDALARVPAVEVEYYFSLTGRLETLALAVDVLVELARQQEDPPARPDDDDE